MWDFGNGTMPDMAPHHFNPAFNALGLDAPVTMEARASFVDKNVTTGSNLVTYQYAARGDRGPLTLFLVRQRPSGRRRRLALIRTTRCNGSAKETTASCWSARRGS